MITEKEFKERCADILRKNITFSHQVGDYVIHGALDALWELHTEQNLNIHSVMQGLPNSEIYKWLKSKNYQYEYDETQEYRMLFELDFPKIIREFVAEHLGSPSVGKAGEDASVSDGK